MSTDTRIIEVMPHNPAWQQQFLYEKAKLAAVWGNAAASIEHLGSTAIPDIVAKPIIDIWIAVCDYNAIDRYVAGMEALGYENTGDMRIAGRRYFRRRRGEQHTHHVHVYQVGHPELDRYRRFVAYLIAHPDAAQAYSTLKADLAKQFRHDRIAYSEGKTAFVIDIDQKALIWWNGRG